MHDTDLRVWPPGADEEYVAARRELLRAEAALRDQRERVAAMRRRLPPGPAMGDYVFTEGPTDFATSDPSTYTTTTLAELVPDDRPLVVYHMMYAPGADEACPMCSMWVDGLHGVSHHLAQTVRFVVVAKAPLDQVRAWARRRGWNGLRVLSSYDAAFNADMGVENEAGDQEAAVSVFTKDPTGTVRHRYTSKAETVIPGPPGTDPRGIDLITPAWHVLDLTPAGRGDFYSGNDYAGAARG